MIGWFADIYSYTNKPPELYVQETRAGAAAKKLTSSPAPDFWDYPWLDAPIVQVPGARWSDAAGPVLQARQFPPRRAGGGVRAWRGLSAERASLVVVDYAHEYLFHHFLMERGYMVIDVDYRGSAGYGRDWRTAIYRHMGGKDLDDNVDAARWLVSAAGRGSEAARHLWRQLRRIYHSDGDVHAARRFRGRRGAAAGDRLGALQSRLHVRHPERAAERCRGVPQVFADLFRARAERRAADLPRHGGHQRDFQDTVRLVQRLIELHKENWELAPYPVENHGFIEPSSWADEYKRIFNLFEKNLKPHA